MNLLLASMTDPRNAAGRANAIQSLDNLLRYQAMSARWTDGRRPEIAPRDVLGRELRPVL